MHMHATCTCMRHARECLCSRLCSSLSKSQLRVAMAVFSGSESVGPSQWVRGRGRVCARRLGVAEDGDWAAPPEGGPTVTGPQPSPCTLAPTLAYRDDVAEGRE